MQTPRVMNPTTFWEDRYRTAQIEEVSWYEPVPHLSLALLELGEVSPSDSVIDIGGGASFFAEALTSRKFTDVSVVDASIEALRVAQQRWTGSASVNWIASDLLQWEPDRTWGFWHDRAVFHFLTDSNERETYRRLLRLSLRVGGVAALATFADDGPTTCSGLSVARYTPYQLETEIGPGFDQIASGRYVHRTPSGAQQPFSWIVLRRAE